MGRKKKSGRFISCWHSLKIRFEHSKMIGRCVLFFITKKGEATRIFLLPCSRIICGTASAALWRTVAFTLAGTKFSIGCQGIAEWRIGWKRKTATCFSFVNVLSQRISTRWFTMPYACRTPPAKRKGGASKSVVPLRSFLWTKTLLTSIKRTSSFQNWGEPGLM